MGFSYGRPTIFNNIYEPTFENIIPIYYGESLPSLPTGSGSYSLKNINLRKYIFQYNSSTKIYTLNNILQGIRFKNINSVIDTNNLQNANDFVFNQPNYSLTNPNNIYGILNINSDNYSLNVVDLISKINIILNNIINGPNNNEFYFVEGFVKKWVVNKAQENLRGANGKNNQYVYNIYRYGVCSFDSTSNTYTNFSYKIIKSIDSNVSMMSSLKDSYI